MTKQKYIMALDAGTTSNRCILFNARGEMCSVAQKEFTQYFPKPGWVEHDANEIWTTQLGVALSAMNEVGASAEDIAAIGITNQRETTIVWEKATGRPIYPAIVWQCRRTAALCDRLRADGLAEHIQAVTGLVPVRIRVKDGRAQSVTLQNVPSFVYSTDQEIHTDHHGTVRADIVFGGNVFALINVDEQGIPMTLESLRPLTNLAMDVLAHVNDDAFFRHPELPAFRKIEFMLLYSDKDAAPGYSGRNCIIFEGEQTDRSPCGTGVSARVADLVHRGRLAIGEETAQDNLMGQRFTGKGVAAVQVGGFPAVRVEISGTAYKTGSCTFLIDENDPLTYGFPFHA